MQTETRNGSPGGTPSIRFSGPRQIPMHFGEESQREERGGSRARGTGLDTTKGLSRGKVVKRSFNTSLRSK